jgi:2-polyprenyl-6-hydroxyphenyl methylase/3-demethylubiquinone-9 3-methyltransferase
MLKISEEIYSRINNGIYDQEGDRWWQSDFSLNIIKTFLNPIRIGYAIKIFNKLKIDPAGKSALEVGCGGGLLCEEIAGIGFKTSGIDPARQSVITASEHAFTGGLKIEYIIGSGEALPYPDNSTDVVFCCDVLEHVQNLPKVISEISRVLKPEGVFLYDTINRTFLSKLVTIKILQEWKRWAIMPSHLHEWRMFIRPGEIKELLLQNHLIWKEHRGVKINISILRILRYLHLRVKGELTYEEFGRKFKALESNNTRVMYLGYAIKEN